MPYPMSDRVREQDRDPESDYKVFLAMEQNRIISEHTFNMVDHLCELEETLPELQINRAYDRQLNKRQNSIWPMFRKELRYVFSLTKYAVTQSGLSKDEKTTIDKIKEYLSKPYGSYKIKYILDLANKYYDILNDRSIVKISWDYTTKTEETSFTER